MAIHKSKNFFIFLIVLVSPAKLQNSPPHQILFNKNELKQEKGEKWLLPLLVFIFICL